MTKYLKHTFFSVYLFFFVLLLIGLYSHSGSAFVTPTLIYFFLPLVLLYLAMQKIEVSLPSFDIGGNKTIKVLLVISLLVAILQFLYLGDIPLITAWSSNLQSEINAARSTIGERTPWILKYLTGWNIKAFVPFLLFTFLKKKKWGVFLIFGIFSSFYAMALMQKAYILWVWAPSFIYLLLNRKWLMASGLGVLNVLVVFFMVFVTNAIIRGGYNDLVDNSEVIENGKVGIISTGLVNRIVYVPGKIVGEWYRIIPSEKPFLYGQDFAPYCKITGKEHHTYSQELYPIIFPHYAARGLSGSVNVAHFMRSYSNFGYIGLALAALLLVCVLWLILLSAKGESLEMSLCFHLFPVVLLNSGSIFTLMMSGGWFMIFVLLWTHKAYIYGKE